MAKSQKRSNREIRKPKQEKKAPAPVVAGSASPVKTVESNGFSSKRKH